MLPVVDGILRRHRRLQENRQLILERRTLRDHSNPFELPEHRFIELYRLSREAVRYLITNIDPHLEMGRYITAIPNHIKVFAALRFYATGPYQRGIGISYNISLSQTSVHRCIRQVTNAIATMVAPQEIVFPQTEREFNQNKENFMHHFGFPGVIGVVDGTHVAILQPREEAHNFLNRKGYYSLNCQIICDSNLKILSINANSPGSHHDAFIWRHSAVRNFLISKYFRNELRGSWLIGDSGYMLEPYLMIPFLNPPDNSPQSRFNRNHILARNCVERCIGLLKLRFRAVLRERTSRYDPQFVGLLVNTCAALHNLCVRFNVPLLDHEGIRNEPFPNINGNVNIPENLLRLGTDMRNTIVNRYFR